MFFVLCLEWQSSVLASPGSGGGAWLQDAQVGCLVKSKVCGQLRVETSGAAPVVRNGRAMRAGQGLPWHQWLALWWARPSGHHEQASSLILWALWKLLLFSNPDNRGRKGEIDTGSRD